MTHTSSPEALLIGRIDHIWDEWTALSPGITLQVFLDLKTHFTFKRLMSNGEYRSMKRAIGKNSWQTVKMGSMTVL